MRDAPSIALCLVVSLLPCPARAANAYDDALAAAGALTARGQLDAAAGVLEAALGGYPQDYALPLQIGWLRYRAGRFAEAERAYRLALARSAGAEDARLGLALALEGQGRCDAAGPIFQALADERPDLEAPRGGLRRCAKVPALHVTPSVAMTGTAFPGHPYKSLAGGATLGLALAHRGGFFASADVRYTRFAPATGAALSAWDQLEGYATIGYDAERIGLLAHYAVVHDGSGVLGTSQHVGLSARWSPLGDVEIRASASFYEDLKLLRVEPSWRIPIALGFSVRPGVAFEDAGGTARVTGLATLAFDHPRFGLWAGGKYGDEERPVLFAVPVVYDVTEIIPYGIWAGGYVNVSEEVRIHLSYAMDRLKQADGSASDAHTLSLGASVSF